MYLNSHHSTGLNWVRWQGWTGLVACALAESEREHLNHQFYIHVLFPWLHQSSYNYGYTRFTTGVKRFWLLWSSRSSLSWQRLQPLWGQFWGTLLVSLPPLMTMWCWNWHRGHFLPSCESQIRIYLQLIRTSFRVFLFVSRWTRLGIFMPFGYQFLHLRLCSARWLLREDTSLIGIKKSDYGEREQLPDRAFRS